MPAGTAPQPPHVFLMKTAGQVHPQDFHFEMDVVLHDGPDGTQGDYFAGVALGDVSDPEALALQFAGAAQWPTTDNTEGQYIHFVFARVNSDDPGSTRFVQLPFQPTYGLALTFVVDYSIAERTAHLQLPLYGFDVTVENVIFDKPQPVSAFGVVKNTANGVGGGTLLRDSRLNMSFNHIHSDLQTFGPSYAIDMAPLEHNGELYDSGIQFDPAVLFASSFDIEEIRQDNVSLTDVFGQHNVHAALVQSEQKKFTIYTSQSENALYNQMTNAGYPVTMVAFNYDYLVANGYGFDYSLASTAAPETNILVFPHAQEATSVAYFEFYSDIPTATFECKLDGDFVWQACSSPKTITDLKLGDHQLQIRALAFAIPDPAPMIIDWRYIDVIAPETTLLEHPTTETTQIFAYFNFESDKTASFECKLDTQAWMQCEGNFEKYENLSLGSHVFLVRAVGVDGVPDPSSAMFEWEIFEDTIAPEITIHIKPSELQEGLDYTFVFGALEWATYECQLDSEPWFECGEQIIKGTLETYGLHTFRVRGADSQGNAAIATASHTWTATASDIAPDTEFLKVMDSYTFDSEAIYYFRSDQPGTFLCSLDYSAFQQCTSPISYTGLFPGAHHFEVKAVDEGGQEDPSPARWGWSIIPPSVNTIITSGPADLNSSWKAEFTFETNISEDMIWMYECRMDGSEWKRCGSGRRYKDLGDGAHTFEVRAITYLGIIDITPASWSWTIVDGEPITEIYGTPASNMIFDTASFVFEANRDATFECSLEVAPVFRTRC